MTGVALAEELLLLAYDDETGKATMPRISLDLGMAAAVLVELALAGRVAYADGNLAVVDPTPTGEPIADAVLAKIAADDPAHPLVVGAAAAARAARPDPRRPAATGAWCGTSTRPSWNSSTCTVTRRPTPRSRRTSGGGWPTR